METKIQPLKPEPFEISECWNSNDEKLLCHMVLLDRFAKTLNRRAGKAFWRTFIVEHRASGVVVCKMRWNYIDTGRSWTHITPKVGTKDPMNYLRRNMENVLSRVAIKMGIPENEAIQSIECFYPPDDGGDGNKTIAWLEQQDLIEVRIERTEEK